MTNLDSPDRIRYFIEHGHGPSVEGMLAIDFDGTLVQRGPVRNPEMAEGAVEFIRRAHAAGYQIYVYTSRLTPWFAPTGDDREAQRAIIRSTLRKHGILDCVRLITGWKIPAALYIDDLAYTFRSWQQATKEILNGDNQVDREAQEGSAPSAARRPGGRAHPGLQNARCPCRALRRACPAPSKDGDDAEEASQEEKER